MDEQREVRDQLKQRYRAFFEEVARLMLTHDPVGINFGCNSDEYEPEAGTVIPRLSSCKSAQDVQAVLHEEFCRWFDKLNAGPLSSYEALARDIWLLMERTDWQRKSAA